MYRPSFAFWYCVFLLAIPSSGKNEEYWENFTNANERSDNSTMPYANSMKNQDNETKLMHYNSRENSVKNKSKTNFILHELNEHSNEDNDNNIVPYKMCNNTCIWHCCNLLIDKCNVIDIRLFFNNNINFTWEAAIAYSCKVNDILFDIMDNENTMFFDNSSLKLSRHEKLLSLLSKCANIFYFNGPTCVAIFEQKMSIYFDMMAAVFIASLLCLLMTFIVYSICPELRNMHGYTLRSYIASLFVVFTISLIVNKDLIEQTYPVCVAESFLYYFCYLAGLLWQTAICFDILWTFGGVRFLQKSVKQSKRKIFLMNSFFVWGIASFYVIICAIMNFVPTVPDNMQPKMCIEIFGFAYKAEIAYFDIPTSVLIICNICFMIFTMLNIMYATKNIDNFLKDAESKHQSKQRSMMYLKLLFFADVNIGLLRIIKWTGSIICETFGILQYVPYYVLSILDTIECLQSFIIFIIFVCKKRIMQLLLKRFGCEKLFVRKHQ